MKYIDWANDKISRLGVTRYDRILNYIRFLEDKSKVKSHNKKVVEQLHILIEEKIKQISRAYGIAYFFYTMIYFSFFSYIFAGSQYLIEVYTFFNQIIAFFGVTIFVIGVFITNKVIDLYYQDLNLLSAHLISIYRTKEVNSDLFSDDDQDAIIAFFKKRGF